jgi:ATP-dependent Zn protease
VSLLLSKQLKLHKQLKRKKMAQEKVKKSPSQIKYGMIQITIKLLALLLFLGLIFIFIMMPTTTYKQKWIPQFNAKINSTYFGAQGHFFFYSIMHACLHSFIYFVPLINNI